MKALVTGGAGYVGSFVAWHLAAWGHEVVVLDSLATGHPEAVAGLPLVVADIRDRQAVREALRRHRPDVCVHLAARSLVAESVREPALYFEANVLGTGALLEELRAYGPVPIIFSSSAAVYGEPEQVPIPEDHPLRPTSYYGETKRAMEGLLAAYDRAYGLRFAALRYFNAAGASADGSRGEDHREETHLIPRVLAVALGKLPALPVFGTDYATPDGTAVRDFVHVEDLAAAHRLAAEHLLRGGESLVLNLGTSGGASVAQVVEVARRVTGHPIPVEERPRRPGDPAVLVASCERARAVLGFEARSSSLEAIVESAWRWHRRHPDGYGGAG